MTEQTIKSVKEILEKYAKDENAHEIHNEIHKDRLEHFNLGVELAQKEFLDKLKIDNFRMFGFTKEAINQLLNEDDNTSILVEVLEELKESIYPKGHEEVKE